MRFLNVGVAFLLTVSFACIVHAQVPGTNPGTCVADPDWGFGCKCDFIELSNKGLTEVPTNMSRNVRQSIDLSSNRIQRIKSGTNGFSNFTALRSTLDLSSNIIDTVEQNAFQGLKDMLVINVSKNKLTRLLSHSFANIKNVSSIDVSGNAIEVIESWAFQNTINITTISLKANKIHTIKSSAFSGLSYVEQLVLTDNVLATIESNAFHQLSNVGSILMSGMRTLETIPTGAFTGLAGVVEIDLHNSGIKTIQEGAFAGLIANDGVFNFSNCQIDTIGGNVFQNVPNTDSARIEQFDLSDNRLITLPYNFFDQASTNNPGVLLEGNPIVCDCGIAWIHFLMQKDEDFYVELTCKEPVNLQGKNFDDNPIDTNIFSNCSANDTSNSISLFYGYAYFSINTFTCIFFAIFLVNFKF